MYWPFAGGLNGDDFYPSDDYMDSHAGSGFYGDRVFTKPDPLFYFSHSGILSFVKKVGKADLLSYGPAEDQVIYVPSKLVRYQGKEIYIHTEIGLPIVMKNMKDKEDARARRRQAAPHDTNSAATDS